MSLKRTGVVCLLFVLVAGMLVAPADAAKRKPKKVTREAVATYRYPAVGSPSTRSACLPCPVFTISATERWVKMEVFDDASLAPVAFSIFQNTDNNNAVLEKVGGPFCGSSGKQPVEITPGVDVGFTVYSFGDVVCPGAVGTTGTVRAVFSNVP